MATYLFNYLLTYLLIYVDNVFILSFIQGNNISTVTRTTVKRTLGFNSVTLILR